jgi:ABC-type multidrug transport system permease subunit
LIAILLTFSGTLLSAYAIVRERERGTLEQLMVTPVSSMGMVTGKLVPYLVLAFVQLVLVLFCMHVFFKVPIHGSVLLLAALSLIYMTSLLSLGLMISARSTTQIEATQGAQAILLPSIMLSGYIFPLSSIPAPLRILSQALPATHFVAISRGIIIRGATFHDLLREVVSLAVISVILLTASVMIFRRKRL